MEEEKNTFNKKILIIGGGVAGLTAGIYGQKAGLQTIIYEKNSWIGGSCSAWKRNGYTIDNCLHWLTGTQEGSADREMWTELGVLQDNVPTVKRPYFLASEADGVTITLWPDIKRTRQEMLLASPEDSDEINNFLDCVEFFAGLITGGMSAKELYNSLKNFNDTMNVKRLDFTRHFLRYMGINSIEMAKRFKCRAIQCLFLDFMAKEYESYWLMLAYSFFISGNGDLPAGGSFAMAQNLKNTYLNAGGKIVTNKAVKQILVDHKNKTFRNFGDVISMGVNPKKVLTRHAPAVLFEDSTTETADYIIAACDINFTYKNLLNNKYTPSSLRRLYKHHKRQREVIYSSFQVAFAVDDLFDCVQDSLGFECIPIQIGNMIYSRITVKNYHPYGDFVAPQGKTVIQVSVPQYIADYKYWKKLSANPVLYNEIKTETAQRIQKEIVRKFPQYKDRLQILDVWTPYSYRRLNNDYYGAYMRYITSPFSFNAFLSSEIPGLDNVILANHCLRYPGGLPTAAYTGRDAIEIIKKEEIKKNARPFLKFPLPFKDDKNK
jgi:phytoene dehydrogenase-like protein